MTGSLTRSEHDIQQSILKYLKKIGIFCWRNNSGVTVIQHRFIRFGAKGAPDIIGVLPDGRFLGIEVKKPGGTLRPEQKDFLDNINKSGGLAFVAKSVDDVKEALKDYDDESQPNNQKLLRRGNPNVISEQQAGGGAAEEARRNA